MSREPNYIKIGLFVVIGISLLVGIVLFFAIGALQNEVIYFETYFDTPVHGLTVGSVIEDRGVPVGKVEKITFVNRIYDVDGESKMGRYVMVIGSVQYDKSMRMPYEEFKSKIARLVDDGLRIYMVVKPLTGIAYLNAEFLDPAKNPPLEISWSPANFYIPSAPSWLNKYGKSIEEILEDLSKVEMAKLSKHLESVLNSLDEMLSSTGAVVQEIQVSLEKLQEQTKDFNIEEFFVGIDSLVESLDKALKDAEVDKLSAQAQELLVEARDAITQFKKVLGDFDTQSSPASIAHVLSQLDTTLWRIENMVQNNDPALNSVLLSTQETVDELKSLIRQIKQNPSGAIFSEAPPKSEILR